MKRPLSLLFVTLASSSVLAASAVPESSLPDIFRKEPPYMQNRVCGELMVNMARMSLDLYTHSGIVGAREAAAVVGTRGMMFEAANAAMTDKEIARAQHIANRLERLATPQTPEILPYKFCEERAERWIKEGVVSAADFKSTEAGVRAALDKVAPLPKAK